MTLYIFSSGSGTIITVSNGQATTVALSSLTFELPLCANANDITGIGTEYHVPYIVKIDELSCGVIE